MRVATVAPNLRYEWQRAVLDALVEYPPVRRKVDAAERAISGRLCQAPADPQEMIALRDALFALQIVFPEKRFEREGLSQKQEKS